MRFLRSLLTIPHVAVVTAFGSCLGLLMRLRDPTGDWVLDLARWWSGWVTRFAGVRVVVDNRANLEPSQPYVFMANHASTVDIWALFLAIPRRVRMIAKKQLARIPLFGWVMWAGRFIFIDRQNAAASRRSIEEAGRRIKGGCSVLIFPEGTRTRDGQIGKILPGVVVVIRRAGVPVVPVVIDGSFQAWPRWRKLPHPHPIRLKYGPPLKTEGLGSEEIIALMDKTLRDMLAELREAFNHGEH